MSLGLKEVLGVNLSFVSKKDKTVTQLTYGDFPPKAEVIDLEVKVNDKKISDIEFKEKHPEFFSLGIFTGQVDFKDWSFTQDYIVKMVDAQILKSLGVTINQDVLDDFPNNLSTYLSFEAQLVRSEIIAWVLGRMAGDFQAQIDADNGYLDQWDTGFDFALQCITFMNNLINRSANKRSILKIGNRHTLLSEPASEGEFKEQAYLDQYKFSNILLAGWNNVHKSSRHYIQYLVDDVLPEFSSCIASNWRNSVASYPSNSTKFKDYLKAIEEQLGNKIYEIFKCKDPSDLYKNLVTTANGTGSTIDQFDDLHLRKLIELTIVDSNSTNRENIEVRVTINLPDKLIALLRQRSWGVLTDDHVFGGKDGENYAKPTQIITIDIPSNANNRLEAEQRTINSLIVNTALELLVPLRKANQTWWEWFKSNTNRMVFGTLPDLIECAKLFTQFRRSQLFYENDSIKGDFERAADCYGAIPTVLEHSLAYIKSGHYFDAHADIRPIKPINITLSGTPAVDSVTLNWNAVPDTTKYYVFKNGIPINTAVAITTQTHTISSLTASTPYSFYINAVNDSGTVLAQSQTLMVTTAPAAE